jgi:hypothetical protein
MIGWSMTLWLNATTLGGSEMRTNIATWERVVRVLVGIALIAIALLVVRGTDVLGYQIIAVAGGLLGADLAITGGIGFCPLYHKLGWGTAARSSGAS